MKMMKNSLRWIILVSAFAPLTVRAEEPAWNKQPNVVVVMADGVELSAHVYLPKTGEKFPAILARTPYRKESMEPVIVPAFTAAGYAVVIQDVRGMGSSKGSFVPFIHEKNDGLATLDWIGKQSWSDGRVGMWGASYLGYSSLIVAPENHPNLKAIFNISGWGDSQELIAPGGAMHLMLGLPWTLLPQVMARGGFGTVNWEQAFKRLPVSSIPEKMGMPTPNWEGMEGIVSAGLLAAQASMVARGEAVKIPVKHVTGWHDYIARHTLDAYTSISRGSAGASQELVVGTWRHNQYWQKTTKNGDEDFGPESAGGAEMMMAEAVRWFDRTIKGQKSSSNRVRVFVMGANEWRNFDAWPPTSLQYQKWYLQSGGGANTADGDGKLSLKPPTTGGADQFVFDPLDPVPTTGGVNVDFFPDNLGPRDQREVEKRKDVLVYTSDPLEQDLTIIGPVAASIFASSEGKSTDFTAKLVEVRADGYARIIEEGIRRGPDAKGGSPASMELGKTYPFFIDLGDTAIVIRKGHRLRVEVSSSNFPKYTRNPNTGEDSEIATEFVKVKQTVRHSAEHPSHVVLPVLK